MKREGINVCKTLLGGKVPKLLETGYLVTLDTKRCIVIVHTYQGPHSQHNMKNEIPT